MAATAELKAKLTITTAQFEAALNRAEAKGKAFAKQTADAINGSNGPSGALSKFSGLVAGFTTGPLAGLGAGFAAAFTARAVYGGIKNVWDMGAGLKILSDRTGATIGGLAQIKAAFGAAGVDLDGLGGSINRLQKEIEAGGEDLTKLGLNLSVLRSQSPDKQFIAVGKAIAAIQDPARRTAEAMAIFGRSGGELLPVFESGAFQSAGGALSGKAKILADNAQVFFESSRALAKAGNVFRGFYIGVASGLGAEMLPILNKLNTMNLSGMGVSFGKGLAGGADMLMTALEKGDKFVASVTKAVGNAGVSVGKILGTYGGDSDSVIFDPHHDGKPWQSKALQNMVVQPDAGDLFRSSGMQFKSSGMQWGYMNGQNITQTDAFSLAGGRSPNQMNDVTNMGPQGATAAHDVGWGAGGLQTAGLLTGSAADKNFAEQRQRALTGRNEAKGQIVSSPDVVAAIKDVHKALTE